jgi:hypothetical protein
MKARQLLFHPTILNGNNSLGTVGDGQGGVWYLSVSRSNPLLCYWRAGLDSPRQWPVPPGALSRGWGQGGRA